MPLQPGDKLGPYEITGELGRGGMAMVFKAHQPSMGRHVAIKVLPEQFLHDPNFLSRFTQEARVIAALEHPRILPVHDFGEAGGVPYIVMRLMPHGSLRDWLRSGVPPLPETVRAIEQIADALDFAHRHNVIHRDLKPDNILLDEAGNAYLSDFGIAKVIEASMATSGTMVVGTPHYMAPEQVKGGKPSPQTDVYALGVMLFELLTGRPPFAADDFLALMYLHANDPVPRLSDFRPDLPQGLQVVIERAMAKTPQARYQSAGELANELREASAEEKPARRRPPTGIPTAPAAIEPPPESETFTPTEIEKRPAAPRTGESQTRPTTPAPSTPLSPFAKHPSGAPVGVVSDGRRASGRWVWAIAALVVGVILIGIIALGGGAFVVSQFFNNRPIAVIATTPASTTTAAFTATRARTPTPLPTHTPTPQPTLGIVSTQISGTDGMVQVFVPAGAFKMGSNSGGSDEQPVHTVTLDDFWIDRTEVTNAMYAKCVRARACQPPELNSSMNRGSYYGNSQFDNYPVIVVSWNDAKAYCEWAGRRLPTEAEWEKAARGTDGRTYPWGDASPDSTLLSFSQNIDVGDTTEVGSYPSGASPYGALDMAGTVWEWVADWYDSNYYANSPSENPSGPASGDERVLRGGSWFDFEFYVRAAYRYWFVPTLRYDFVIGFRCARSP